MHEIILYSSQTFSYLYFQGNYQIFKNVNMMIISVLNINVKDDNRRYKVGLHNKKKCKITKKQNFQRKTIFQSIGDRKELPVETLQNYGCPDH